MCHSFAQRMPYSRNLVRVRSWMERYQQLAVAAAVALFLRTSRRRHARASSWPANPPVHLFLVDGTVGRLVKVDVSSLQYIREMVTEGQTNQCYSASYCRAGPESQRFGGILREEFSDDWSCSRRLSRDRTLLVVASQLQPCVLCVYRSEQPISHSSSPSSLALARL